MFVIKTGQDRFKSEEVERCADVLKSGGIGIIPTDTVYGLAASALDAAAVERLLRVKQRPSDKPLPVQVGSSWDANLLGVADTPAAVALIERFWPGPLTIVMERRQGTEIPYQSLATIGIRVPASRFCLALMSEAGYLVVPSANLPGDQPPITVAGIAPEVRDAVDFIVDAGECPGGVESTVVDISAGIEVLREGAVSRDEVLSAMRGDAGGRHL